MEERLQRRYELAKCDQYKEIRKEVLDYLVEKSFIIPPMDIPCMLRVLSIIDNWVDDYEGYIAKEREKKGID